MSKSSEATVLGKISYTNAWPVFHYFDSEKLTHPVEVVTEVPAVLNKRIHEGTLDLSAMSSFAYGLESERLLILPDVSVSSRGEVKSILLFSKKKIEEIDGGTIALTNTSATSVNLLKILMMKFYEINPQYVTVEPDLSSMMEVADAALLIGDHAIRASWTDHGYYVYDLGERWYHFTNQSMTFAVWAVSADYAEDNSEIVQEITNAFKASKTRSLEELTPVVEAAEQQIGGTKSYWYDYFQNLCYDFGENELQGLQLYFRYAHELGLMAHEVRLDLWNENKLIRVTE
ncbi:menaquinone biosynthesis protein [Paenibacillus sp. Marseille-Q4541]|uniref:menaquinone biosynthetic enzyme MqnA/MqnD family protein n=1 Tax=Paenibacillus sp. Marseille-Q4541 TaxID=2831522 RepID=UPI001BAD630F|nr:menaquinone biosynthesis protein [Paenibacillus sp. Marseille-Q4541]